MSLTNYAIDIQLKSTSRSSYSTYGSRTVELFLGGKLFIHDFICARVKYPILGRDFLASKNLMENYSGSFLNNFRSTLFNLAIDFENQKLKSIKHATVGTRQTCKGTFLRFPQRQSEQQPQSRTWSWTCHRHWGQQACMTQCHRLFRKEWKVASSGPLRE